MTMKRFTLMMAVMAMFVTAGALRAQNYGIVFGELEVTEANAADIFGDGMASYDVATNVLVLRDGFTYNLSHDLVTINTGREFRIVLEGAAAMVASIDCNDPIAVESVDENTTKTLKITSNISGSAIKCQKMVVKPYVFLDLISRNSQSGMYALDCEELMVDGAMFFAEVTTADLAVHTNVMTLKDCYLRKPAGGGVNAAYGGICYADGTPAKLVRITVNGEGLDEIEMPEQDIVKKIFEKGQVVIIKDGHRYDLTGREL